MPALRTVHHAAIALLAQEVALGTLVNGRSVRRVHADRALQHLEQVVDAIAALERKEKMTILSSSRNKSTILPEFQLDHCQSWVLEQC